jgi:hypothetical protein
MRSALVADPFSGEPVSRIGWQQRGRRRVTWTGLVISLRNAFLAQLAAKDVCEKRVR